MSGSRTAGRNATAAAALIATAALLTGCATTTAVAAGTTAEPSAASPTAVPTAPAERAWVGTPSATLEAAERVVSAATLGHDDVFAGTAYAHDYSVLTVYATDLDAPAVAGLTAALRGRPAASQVRFEKVRHSQADLLAAVASIHLDAIAGFRSVGPDAVTNRLTLGRDDTAGEGPAVGTTVPLSQLTGGPAGGAGEILVDVVREQGEFTAAPAPAVGR
ncbi:hypothetical protein [Leifsonia sp. NPDC080035]|uniref:Uncharacterized protein n=1 Tax=Leifsonia sp. NPDC080035 TaxID=3143936 RepID=A0AAU7GA72_9MICO